MEIAAAGANSDLRRGREQGDGAMGRTVGGRIARAPGGKPGDMRQMIDAFREGGGEGKRIVVQSALC